MIMSSRASYAIISILISHGCARMVNKKPLITKNHVVESVSTLQNAARELQPLDFVGVTNQLAIGGPLESPALLLLRSPYHGLTHGNSMLCQPLWILALVISSFLCICWSMKALASKGSFLGLPEQSKFATEPVRRSFLIMWMMPEGLTTKPSPFKVFNILAGWRPWLWRNSIWVLTWLEYFGMINT